MDDVARLHAFLWFGFVPRVPPSFAAEPWAVPGASDAAPAPEAELVHEGARRLKALFAEPGEGQHVVPLSGGLDSRVILAGLLEGGARDRITAVTFGTPGTLDYDLGRQVARAAGVEHVALDLTRERVEPEHLLDTVRAGGAWTHVYEAYYGHLVAWRFGTEPTYWSGYAANTIAGSHAGPDPPGGWAEALRAFAARNRFSRSVALPPPSFDPLAVLPSEPLLTDTDLVATEQLHLVLRYGCRYRQTLLPRGHDYRTPFLDPDWVAFLLALPFELRHAQTLYRRAAREAFPDLLALPTKAELGLTLGAPAWRRGLRRVEWAARNRLHRLVPRLPLKPHPKTNYVDFDRELRAGGVLHEAARELLQRLRARGVVDWIDLDAIWRRHQERRTHHGDALVLLTSLEANLAVEEEGAGREEAALARAYPSEPPA